MGQITASPSPLGAEFSVSNPEAGDYLLIVTWHGGKDGDVCRVSYQPAVGARAITIYSGPLNCFQTMFECTLMPSADITLKTPVSLGAVDASGSAGAGGEGGAAGARGGEAGVSGAF
jgi:hypothetical protein